MSKFFLPERLPHDVFLLNENVWFERYQELLLTMANTKVGRDLLLIPQEYGRIVYMTKNAVHYLTKPFKYGERIEVKADFRVGAKWGDVIRNRWSAFNSYARYFIAGERVGSPLTQYARSVCAATIVVYPDPDPETTTFDGYVENYYGTWAAMHDDTTCQLARPSDSGFYIDDFNGGTSYGFDRGMTLFDTSSLTSLATITDTIIEAYCVSKSDQRNAGSGAPDKISLVSASPASNTNIVVADFNDFGTTRFATDVDISGMSTSTWITFTFVAAGLAAVSKTGVTKIGWRSAGDVDNNAGPNPAEYTNGAGYASAESANDPKMTVTYTLPAAFNEVSLNRSPLRGVMRGVMRP